MQYPIALGELSELKQNNLVSQIFYYTVNYTNRGRTDIESNPLLKTICLLGLTQAKIYINDDGLHNMEGPARSLGPIEMWWSFGMPHRLDGPAVHIPGEFEEYRIHGHYASKNNFYDMQTTSYVNMALLTIQHWRGDANVDHIRKVLRYYGDEKSLDTMLLAADLV